MLLLWQELARLLEQNQGITKLQLNSINVGDEVCSLILSQINAFTWSASGSAFTWSKVAHSSGNRLSCNVLALESLIKLAESHQFSHSGLQGAKALAEMLKKNVHITHLELNNNVIDYAVPISAWFRSFWCVWFVINIRLWICNSRSVLCRWESVKL